MSLSKTSTTASASRSRRSSASTSTGKGKKPSVVLLSAKLKRCALYCTRNPNRPDRKNVGVTHATTGITHEVVIVDPSRRQRTTMAARVIPTGVLIVLPLCPWHAERMTQMHYWPNGPQPVPFDLEAGKATISEVAKAWRVAMSPEWVPLLDAAFPGLADPLNGEGVTH